MAVGDLRLISGAERPQPREASADWTDLGAGPMLLQAIEGEIKFAVADLNPAAGAITFTLGPEHGPHRPERVFNRVALRE